MEREVVTLQEGTSCFLGEEVVTPPSRILYDLGFIVVCFSAGWSSSYTVKVCFSAGWSSTYIVMICFTVDFVFVGGSSYITIKAICGLLLSWWLCVCSKEWWACGEVLEQRPVSTVMTCFNLIISFLLINHVSPAQRGNNSTAGWIQGSWLGAVIGVEPVTEHNWLPLCWALNLHLCFSFYFRARDERERARCHHLMNGLPLWHVVSIKKSACHHKVTLPSLSCTVTSLSNTTGPSLTLFIENWDNAARMLCGTYVY